MPSPVGQQPVGRAGSTTVVQAPYGTQVTKPTSLTRALVAIRKVFFTAQDLADPQRLYQVVYQIQQGLTTGLRALASSPLSAGNLLRGNVFTSGQTLYLNHGLGRPYTGYLVGSATLASAASSAAYGGLYDIPTDSVAVSLTTSAFVQIPLQHAGPSSGTTLTTGSSGHITVASAGTYLMTATMSVFSSVADRLTFSVFVNGSAVNDLQTAIDPQSAFAPVAVTNVHTLNAGDVVDVRVSQASPATNTVNITLAQFSVALLGGGASAGLTLATLPSGVTSDKQVGLTAGAAGTYDVFVF